jgi:hypothetical protein
MLAAPVRERLNSGVPQTLLEPFWPSRRSSQFDELCRPVA